MEEIREEIKEDLQILNRIDRDKMISKEVKKLEKIFKNIEDDKVKFVRGLIDNAAFIFVTLYELREIMLETGTIENFENGSQRLLREHPAMKNYNSLIKSYTTIMKQLFEFLPDGGTGTQEKDEFLSFIKKSK